MATSEAIAGSAVESASAERRARPWPRYERATKGLRNHWYPALRSRDLGRKPVPIVLLGEELMIARITGGVTCLPLRCLHRGVPLTAGRCEFEGTISCPFHGWTYDLATGKLVAALTDGPESSIVGKVGLRVYPARELQGLVWVFIGDIDPPPLEDEIPEAFSASDVYIGCRIKTYVGNWRIAMEGSLDPSHPFYLHRSAWLSTPLRLPAARGRHWAEVVDDRYFTYRTEPPVPEADYPGLGAWPRQPWWKRSGLGKLDVRGFLPCGAVVKGLTFNKPFDVYSWYVPVDADRYMWFQVLLAHVTGWRRLWARLKYNVWLRWLYQGQFLEQDARMNELVHPFYADGDGWHRERLFRPDVVITAWRRFVDERARGIQE